jgi:hypothetical protein
MHPPEMTALEAFQAREVALDVLLEKHSPVKPYAYKWAVYWARKPQIAGVVADEVFYEPGPWTMKALLLATDLTKVWGELHAKAWLPVLGKSFASAAELCFRAIDSVALSRVTRVDGIDRSGDILHIEYPFSFNLMSDE